MKMLITYPVYTPTYSGYTTPSDAEQPSSALLAPHRPRLVGAVQDDDDCLDWGDGDSESGGTTIGDANGMHGGEGLPVGDAIYPLILCLIAYFAIKRRVIARLM